MKSGARIVVKVGGAILDDAEARARFAAAVASARNGGADVVVVHGGGAQVSRLMEALGLQARRIQGLRVTDADTAQAVVQGLRGQVNAELTAALVDHHVPALGLSGVDDRLMTAEVLDPVLGQVGRVTEVNARLLKALCGQGFVPVVATVAHADGQFLNVNADDAVAPLAEGFGADAVLFLSDVAAVLDGDAPIASIDGAAAEELVERQVVTGGMLPKVQAALDAARRLPRATVRMASGLADDPIEAALAGGGTLFVADAPKDESLSGETVHV